MSGLISGRAIIVDANHLTVASGGDELQVALDSNYLQATTSGLALASTIGGTQVSWSTTPAILNLPSAGTDAANKNYVDQQVASVSAGMSWKDAVRVISTTDVSTSSAPSSIDGVTLSSGDRVALTGQSVGSQNGIWVFNGAAAAMSRPSDFNTGDDAAGATFVVNEGSEADTIWHVIDDTGAAVIDTDALTIQKFPIASYSAGSGIDITGNVISVVADSVTGGDVAAVSVTANGVGVDVTTLDGDHLTISWSPTNYTPDTTPAEAADSLDLTAHLAGIDSVIADLYTLSGTAVGDVNLGTFTGTTISDNVSIKTALQELETALEAVPVTYREIFTLTSTDITNKKVTLANTPTSPSDTVANWTIGGTSVVGGGITVTGADVSWAGYAWDGVLVAGDTLVITYS